MSGEQKPAESPSTALSGPGKGPARGYSWEAFRPGEPGPRLSHECYSSIKLAPRSEQIADELRQVLPLYSPSDEVSVRLLAMALARVERAAAALDAIDEHLGDSRKLAAFLADDGDRMERLRKDMRGWIGTATKLLNELGLTPSARMRLGIDAMLAQRAADAALDRLAEQGREIREVRES